VLRKLNIPFQQGGTYLVMEGPQFSSLAESKLYRSWGCDVIGMTNMPEAKLAREAEIRYASVSMVTDFDCWHPDHDDVSVDQVIKTLLGNAEKAKKVVAEVLMSFEEDIDPKDPANNCLDVAVITDKKYWTKETIKNLSNIAGRVLNK
jgi:5'-methylthioadenosine phosphorylase